MISTIQTSGDYSNLVDGALIRGALHLQGNSPSNTDLASRIEEASQRIEGLTRLVLAESVWIYEIFPDDFREHGVGPDYFRLPGLFPVGVDPTVSITDDDGDAVVVTSTVEGSTGDCILIRTTTGTFLDYYLPLKVQITRGVSASQLPGDLAGGHRDPGASNTWKAFQRQCPKPPSSARCSRYGWVG